MRNYRLLLVGGFLMFFVGSISLFFDRPIQVYAGGEVCGGSACSVTDTTLADFAQGTFYVTGLRNQFDGEVQLLPIGLATQWVTDTKSLPGQRAELAAVISRDIIYAIGGRDQSVARSEIFSATTLITGSISASGWTTPTNLPSPRVSAAAAISPTQNGAFLYVVGGATASGTSNFTSTILYHSLDTNGNFTGSWITTSLPFTSYFGGIGLVYAQAVAHNGFLYVIGGYDGSVIHTDIFRAPINTGGSLGTWVQDQSLPNNRSSHAATVWASGGITDSLYVLGGLSETVGTGQPQVYISSFTTTNTLEPFTSSAYPLPVGYYAHAAAQANAEIFVTGGYQSGVSPPITNSVQSALISTNGELGSNWATSFPLPQARAYHATVINSGGEVYVIGGYSAPADGGTATSTVYHGSTSGIGSSYSPAGIYTSRIINLGALHPLTSIVANTTVSSTNPITLSLLYRAATSESGLLAAGWTTLGNAPAGENISTTFSLGGPSASFVQYRALYTNTAPFNSTPTLNAVQIVYPVTPDFLISANPPSLSVTPGQGVTSSAQLTATNGFSLPVTLSVSGLPSGTSALFGSNPITPTASTVLTITTLPTVTTGTYPLSLIGDSGTVSHTASILLSIMPTADFTMTTTPLTRTVNQGLSGIFTTSLTTTTGFSSPVAFSLVGLPAGASAAFATNPLTPPASTVFTVTTLPTITVGTYPLTLYGNGGTITHTNNLVLYVGPSQTTQLPDFRITEIVAPPAVGTAMTRTITITVINQGTANYGPIRLANPTTTRSTKQLPTPVLRQPTGVSRPRSGLTSPSVYTQTTDYFFWVAPYIDRPPTGVTDVGNCRTQSGQLNLPWVYSVELPMGGTRTVYANCWLTAGTHTFYAQADICDSPPDTCSDTYGYILERNETNNVLGPVTSGSTISGPKLFLPLIMR